MLESFEKFVISSTNIGNDFNKLLLNQIYQLWSNKHQLLTSFEIKEELANHVKRFFFHNFQMKNTEDIRVVPSKDIDDIYDLLASANLKFVKYHRIQDSLLADIYLPER